MSCPCSGLCPQVFGDTGDMSPGLSPHLWDTVPAQDLVPARHCPCPLSTGALPQGLGCCPHSGHCPHPTGTLSLAAVPKYWGSVPEHSDAVPGYWGPVPTQGLVPCSLGPFSGALGPRSHSALSPSFWGAARGSLGLSQGHRALSLPIRVTRAVSPGHWGSVPGFGGDIPGYRGAVPNQGFVPSPLGLLPGSPGPHPRATPAPLGHHPCSEPRPCSPGPRPQLTGAVPAPHGATPSPLGCCPHVLELLSPSTAPSPVPRGSSPHHPRATRLHPRTSGAPSPL